ncbi:uncharacterized protein RHOBADRAFT_66530 [Rhodotorula graminis WP1]|uniref:Uncharacterized protein n=1 Tax=Rhodotorula graminis (strain WP1) TaxID=578459 RepID=A0A194S2S5_RHOGW|nr:uncharacterized protein RHOBADRAFT_66530 [Rhodotorula graminis WP1]KPV75033.1 hypothetical protein RHOBADRAFT_66530 [Rhodotorula graminis WP1]
MALSSPSVPPSADDPTCASERFSRRASCDARLRALAGTFPCSLRSRASRASAARAQLGLLCSASPSATRASAGALSRRGEEDGKRCRPRTRASGRRGAFPR